MFGSLTMIVLAILCLRQVVILYRQDRENPLNTYLLWLVAALFSLCLFRSVGHIARHLLTASEHLATWNSIAPWSGGLNTGMFIVIFAITLFFRDVLVFMNRMTDDRAKIETTSKQLLALNKEIESVVSDRTRAEMALNLAHEIRNPVMIISGLLRRLRRTAKKGTDAGSDYHREIKQQIDHLEALVARFEDMQAVSRESFSPVNLGELLAKVVGAVQGEAKNKQITLRLSPVTTNAFCLGNEQYLSSAFLHLLRNALAACQSGGTVEVCAVPISGGTTITIRDNGYGIPENILSHVFEPFFSSRDGATGMGLPYVQQIIREHHGDITLSSILEKGTLVEVFIPSHLDQLHS
jgi:signal transduction histidine kinase